MKKIFLLGVLGLVVLAGCSNKTTDMKALNSRLIDLEDQVSSLESTIYDLQSSIEDIKSSIDDNSNELGSIRSELQGNSILNSR